MGDLADSFVGVPRLRGLAERVYEMEEQMLALPPRPPPSNTGTDEAGIQVANVTIKPPVEGVAPLFSGLDISVGAGEHTVIRGPNGVGKSSLFRTMRGLWDGGEGGSVSMPPSCFVFPQDSYFPHGQHEPLAKGSHRAAWLTAWRWTAGSLAEQIAYPDAPDGMASDEDSRAEAWELLTAVGLKPWLDENGFGLDTVQDWHAVLSGGQKQRLAWVRMYHHKPAFALIDEGTSAVDRESVDQLFLHAKKMGITMLTISHHVRLLLYRPFHCCERFGKRSGLVCARMLLTCTTAALLTWRKAASGLSRRGLSHLASRKTMARTRRKRYSSASINSLPRTVPHPEVLCPAAEAAGGEDARAGGGAGERAGEV